MERCYGCLCLDRKLVPIEEFRSLYCYLLFNSKTSQCQLLPGPFLCWECYQKLTNIKKFQKNILQAQKFLTKYYEKAVEEKEVQCLSSLMVQVKSQYDYVFEDKELSDSNEFTSELSKNVESTKDLTDVKQEPNYDSNMGIESMDSDYLNYADYDNFYSHEANEQIKTESQTHQVPYMDDDEEKFGPGMEVIIKNKRLARKATDKLQYRKICVDRNNFITKYRCVKLNEIEMLQWRKKKREQFEQHQHKCETCLVSFSTESKKKIHAKKKHSQTAGDYVCKICQVRVKSSVLLNKHTSDHYVKYDCTLCNEDFQKCSLVKSHLKRAHGKILQCNHCRLAFQCKQDFYTHYNQIHPHVYCDHCHRKYTTKNMLIKHIQKKHTMFKCDECGSTYKNLYSMTRHKRKKHVVAPSEATYCVECDIRFNNEQLYSDHVKYGDRHRCKRTVLCPECGKAYSKRWNMLRHFDYAHTEKTNFYCEPCNRYFLNGYRLRTHTSSFHNKLRPPKNKICQYCNRGFSTNRILANHILTHTGERPHACPECPARFTQAIALKSHINTQHVRPAERLFLQIK